MTYGTSRNSPDPEDDMAFAVAYVEDGVIEDIVNGPYAKVGPARAQVSYRRNRKRGGTPGDYKLIVTKIDWVIIDE